MHSGRCVHGLPEVFKAKEKPWITPEGSTTEKIIDTPGMREFGLVDISKQELSHYFPEMRSRLSDCQFNNCQHMNEPGCAIKKAVDEEKINIDRYISYCTILDSIEERKY